MKQIGLWCLMLGTLVYVQAATIDIYKPAGENKSCNKEISSLLAAAYRHYPSITASEKMVLGAQAQVESAKWNYFPTPSVDLSQGTGGRGQTYRLDQPIWTGGKLDALSDIAYARSDEAKHTLGESSYALAEKVLLVLQYYIQADGEIKAFTEGKEDLENMAEMLERRVGSGISSESDQYLINSRIYQIEGDLMTAVQRHEMATSQLELLIGRKMNCGLVFKKDRILKKKISLRQTEEAMLHTHPTLKKMTAQVDIANAEKSSADAIIMPTVSLRAEHLRDSLYENNPTDNDTLVYVAVSFNPGAGLSSLSNIESAKYKILQAQDERRTREQELKDALVRDYTDYMSASNRLESMLGMIESSEKVLESYKRLFVAGKRQWLDLVNASREVTQNYIALATLRATLISSSYRLAIQAGKIEFENSGRY